MTVISMSHQELYRLRVVIDLVEDRLTATEAATLTPSDRAPGVAPTPPLPSGWRRT
jgi:hypothetical protein